MGRGDFWPPVAPKFGERSTQNSKLRNTSWGPPHMPNTIKISVVGVELGELYPRGMEHSWGRGHFLKTRIVKQHHLCNIPTYLSKFTAASRGSPGDSTAFLLLDCTAGSMIGYRHVNGVWLADCLLWCCAFWVLTKPTSCSRTVSASE